MRLKDRIRIFFLITAILSALFAFHESASIFGIIGGTISLLGSLVLKQKPSSDLSFYGIKISKLAIFFCSLVYVSYVLLADIITQIIVAVFY